MHGEHLRQGFREVLEQMKAVRDLGRRGGSLACALRIGLGAVTRDDLHPRMLPEPLRHGVGGALGQERHGVVALLIDQHRARGLAFPQGEIVHTQHGRSGVRRDGETAQQTQQGIPAHHQVPALAEAHTGLAS